MKEMRKLFKYTLLLVVGMLSACQSDVESQAPVSGIQAPVGTMIPLEHLSVDVDPRNGGTRCITDDDPSITWWDGTTTVTEPDQIQNTALMIGEKVNLYTLTTASDGVSFKPVSKGVYQVDGKAYSGGYYVHLAPYNGEVAYYPTGYQCSFYATYPSDKSSNVMTSFTVEDDQSTQAGYRASDLMTGRVQSTNTNKDATSSIWITLQHKLCKIRLRIYTVPGHSPIIVKKVVMKNVMTTVSVNALSGALGSELSRPHDIVMFDDPANTAETVNLACILPPQDFSGAMFEITDMNDRVSVYQMESEFTFESGSEYSANVCLNEFKMGALIPEAKLWVDDTYGDSAPTVTPLAYMAEGNVVSPNGNSNFSLLGPTDEQTVYNYTGGYWNYEYSVQNFGTSRLDAADKAGIQDIAGVAYHGPSHQELYGILPELNLRMVTSSGVTDNEENDLEVHGLRFYTKADYKKHASNSSIIYGRRFKGTFYHSAWRYRLVTGTPNYLEIKSVYLGTATDNINTISNESWWNTKESGGLVVTRQLVAAGFVDNSGKKNASLSTGNGFYWSGDAIDDTKIYGFYWNYLAETNELRALHTTTLNGQFDLQPFRLFKND